MKQTLFVSKCPVAKFGLFPVIFLQRNCLNSFSFNASFDGSESVIRQRIGLDLAGPDLFYGPDVLEVVFVLLGAADALHVAGEEPVGEQQPAAVAVALQRPQTLRSLLVIDLEEVHPDFL